MTLITRRRAAAFAVLALFATAPLAQAQPVSGADRSATTLFKVITTKDEIIIGLNEQELAQLGGADAGTLARALAGRGELSAWQYGVRRGPNNEPHYAPTQRVGLLANASLRIEPFKSPYPVIPHD